MDNPFAIAVAAGIRAGENRAVSREYGGLKGLDRVADRYSRLAERALNTGLQRLGLGDEDPAAAPTIRQRGDD